MGHTLPPLPDFPAVLLARQRRRRRIWLVVAVVLLAAGLVARPAYRAAKRWRSRALAAEAEGFASANNWSVAVTKAKAAYQLAPAEPGTLRTVARIAGHVGAGATLGYWKGLLGLPQATTADRIEAVRYALQVQQFDFAEEQLQVLLAADSTARETLELSVQYAMEKGDRAAALDCARLLVTYHPEDTGAALTRAELLLGAPEPAQVQLGWHALRKLGKGRDAFALRALETQARSAALPPEEIPAVADALDAHPEATAEDHLQAETLRLRLHPEQRAEKVEQAIARFGTGPEEARLALARWLLQRAEPARVAELTATDAVKKQEFFLVRADALAALGRWKELEAALGEKKAPLETFYREIFLARTARELEDARGTAAHWDLAILAAARDPRKTSYLSEYARQAGEHEVAIKAWRQLATDARFTLRADLAMVPSLEATMNTGALREVIREIARLTPADLEPQNDEAYLDLLLGEKERFPAARQTAERLVRAHPELIVFRTTLALALLRSGEPAAALKLYDGVTVGWPETLPRCQAVYAAVLAANGEAVGAGRMAAGLAKAMLLGEERQLLP